MTPADFPNIIFDLGGVILNIDYQRTIAAFRSLGAEQFDAQYSQLDQTAVFDAFEKGLIGPQQFRNALRQALQIEATDSMIDEAWNAMLLDLPVERLQLLERLKNQKKLALLSNTNRIHVTCFEQRMQRDLGIPNLDRFFYRTYYSCNMGMRKPDREIFSTVTRQCGFEPEETLFIDDSVQHVEGAKNAGLHAYHLRTDRGETILDLF